MLLLVFAFVAGLITILSPCILPLVPLVLATGEGGGKWRPVGVMVGLAASFTAATLVLAALLTALGLPADLLRWIGIVALAGFGLVLLVPALTARFEPLLSRLAATGARGSSSGFAGGVLLDPASPAIADSLIVSNTNGIYASSSASVPGLTHNDIVGNDKGGNGIVDGATIRVYSEGPEDSPSRELARFHFNRDARLRRRQLRVGFLFRDAPDAPGVAFRRNGQRRFAAL